MFKQKSSKNKKSSHKNSQKKFTNLHVVKIDTVNGPNSRIVRNIKYCPSAEQKKNAHNLKKYKCSLQNIKKISTNVKIRVVVRQMCLSSKQVFFIKKLFF